MSKDTFIGYVQNTSSLGVHIMKRYVASNGKIPLEELYQEYGEKHGLKRDKEFINWLFEVKLRNKNKWKVVEEDVPEPKKERPIDPDAGEEDVNKSPNRLSVEEIIELSVRKAREVIPYITDQKLLKYSLKDAAQRPNKKVLCEILRSRINDLESIGITS
jgi:ribosomal protein L20A (L18A)